MAESDQSVAGQSNPFKSEGLARGWPDGTRELAADVFKFSPEELRGQGRLGDLSFDEAPEQVMAIKDVLGELALEPWDELPQSFASELQGKIEEVKNKLDQIVELSATSENPGQKRERFASQLAEMQRWFTGEAKAHARRAWTARILDELSPTAISTSDFQALSSELDEVRGQAERLNRELDSRQEALAQVREGAGDSASHELAQAFRDRAEGHKRTAERWLKALVAAGPLAVIGAIGTFLLLKPNDGGSTSPNHFAALGLGLFIFGVLAYGIRVCAQNYRVNRHLEAVAMSRATAIATFQRLVASVEDAEIRSAVAIALAQAIFSTEETGLVDGSGDHVTLVERAILPNLPKSAG